MSAACAVALVLMLDSSSSVSTERFAFQRDSTADALESEPVMHAIQAGGLAISAMGFSYRSKVLVGWSVLRSAVDAHRFALALRATNHSYGPSTLTGAGLASALEMLDSAPCGDSRVVDVSTDGPGDDDIRLEQARSKAQKEGVRVNGLLVTPEYPPLISMEWREEQVEKGLDWMRSSLLTQDGFAIHANSHDEYPAAIRRKMAAEVACAWPEAYTPGRTQATSTP